MSALLIPAKGVNSEYRQNGTEKQGFLRGLRKGRAGDREQVLSGAFCFFSRGNQMTSLFRWTLIGKRYCCEHQRKQRATRTDARKDIWKTNPEKIAEARKRDGSAQ
jgi:hypothetical protein